MYDPFQNVCINILDCDNYECIHTERHNPTEECRPRICDYSKKEVFCVIDVMKALNEKRSYLTKEGKKENAKRRHEFLKRGGLI